MKKSRGMKTEQGRGVPPTAPSAPAPATSAAPAPSSSGGAPPAGTPFFIRWFTSSTVRQGNAMRKHVQKILDSQRDILQPNAVQNVSTALADLRTALVSGVAKTALLERMENLEKVANNWLKPYPNAAWRENIEVLLVALTVAMAIRTFFLQPFKIPTGSMQPTLFGVTSVPDFTRPAERNRLEMPPQVEYPPLKER